MIKALLLDLDKTLCDTDKADQYAKEILRKDVENRFGDKLDSQRFVDAFHSGIYRNWSDKQRSRYMPIIEQHGEGFFRTKLIIDLLSEQEIDPIAIETAEAIQTVFNKERLAAFDFFPNLSDFLLESSESYTLIVITNGPEFSQQPKIDRVKLSNYVDHIIIGGLEPEEKPSASIFNKALELAKCDATEAIHIGDSLIADISGANKSGIMSIWVKHQQQLDSKSEVEPHFTVDHPSEIPRLIKQITAG